MDAFLFVIMAITMIHVDKSMQYYDATNLSNCINSDYWTKIEENPTFYDSKYVLKHFQRESDCIDLLNDDFLNTNNTIKGHEMPPQPIHRANYWGKEI